MRPKVAQANRSGADGQSYNEDYMAKTDIILVRSQWNVIFC